MAVMSQEAVERIVYIVGQNLIIHQDNTSQSPCKQEDHILKTNKLSHSMAGMKQIV